MIRKYVDGDIDVVMQIWLNTNIQAHSFISLDYWKSNFDMVKEMMPLAEIYVHEVDNANQIDGFIGLNNDYIEGIFIKDVTQSKGIGKQLLDQVKKIRVTLKLNVYQKNERAIQFYLREEFSILSTTIYLWLISLTASKELSILLLKLYNDGAIGISDPFLDFASVIQTDNQLLIRSVRFMQVEPLSVRSCHTTVD